MTVASPAHRLGNSNKKVRSLLCQRRESLQYNPSIFRMDPERSTGVIRLELQKLSKVILAKDMR
jgi:hypothetical protein